jgi:phosphoglycerate dehydrogenase-like enzyme
MKGKILITDSLFIFEEHERLIKEAGYEIERLDKPEATEKELIEAIKGKIGYILGGIEKVTEKVIQAADELKVICFTGADAHGFIPAFDSATQKGIAITTTPGTNTYAVAEYTLSVILAMTRNLFELGRTGGKSFQTTHSLNELTVGIVGMGHIGSRMAELLHALGVKKILYTNRTRRTDIEGRTGAQYVEMDELLSMSDIVTLHVSKEVGEGFIGKNELSKMKGGALVINCGFMGGVNRDDLLVELESGRLRAAEDGPKDERFSDLPLSVWYCSNEHTAYNTHEANKTASDMAVRSLLSVLETGEDKFKVN